MFFSLFVSFIFYWSTSEPRVLRNYWMDLYRPTNFQGLVGKSAFLWQKFSLLHGHSEKDWNIRMAIRSSEAHWMWLHRVQIWWWLVEKFRRNVCLFLYFCEKKLQKLAYPAYCRKTCWTNLDYDYIYRYVGGDDKYDACFEIVPGTLLR